MKVEELPMSENTYVERSASGAFVAAVAVAVLLGLGALVWCYGLQNHLTQAESRLAAADARNADLVQKLDSTNAQLRATSETLGQSVGMTQKQLETRAAAIMAAQRSSAARIEHEQKATEQQLGQVATDVNGVKTDVGSVKTDVGGVKTDVASTKQDLEDTKVQLTRVVGDAGVMSGQIARTHDELEMLKHKGDRNYYEFTLHKGQQPTLLATIKLQLKKADEKHSRFTLNVNSDDKTIEKKDKGLDEPVQFYTGKSPVLYEVVVNSIGKNQVTGYLSTPKGSPQAPSLQ
jgi:chromosome segregation ATPase